jgi:hypothetical protein
LPKSIARTNDFVIKFANSMALLALIQKATTVIF